MIDTNRYDVTVEYEDRSILTHAAFGWSDEEACEYMLWAYHRGLYNHPADTVNKIMCCILKGRVPIFV